MRTSSLNCSSRVRGIFLKSQRSKTKQQINFDD
jgi:hypothetical protein